MGVKSTFVVTLAMLTMVCPLAVQGYHCEPSVISSSIEIQSNSTAMKRLAFAARSHIAFPHSPVRNRLSPGPLPASRNSPRFAPRSMNPSGESSARQADASPFSLSRLTLAIMGNSIKKADSRHSESGPPPEYVPMVPPAPNVP